MIKLTLFFPVGTVLTQHKNWLINSCFHNLLPQGWPCLLLSTDITSSVVWIIKSQDLIIIRSFNHLSLKSFSLCRMSLKCRELLAISTPYSTLYVVLEKKVDSQSEHVVCLVYNNCVCFSRATIFDHMELAEYLISLVNNAHMYKHAGTYSTPQLLYTGHSLLQYQLCY